MNIHDFLKAKEGEIWNVSDTAEVERILREIDRLAEAAVLHESARFAACEARRRT